MVLILSLILLAYSVVGNPIRVFSMAILAKGLYLVPSGYDVATYAFFILFLRIIVPHVVLKKEIVMNKMVKFFLLFYSICVLSFVFFNGQFAKELVITNTRIAVVLFLFFHLFKSVKDISRLLPYIWLSTVFVLIHIYTQYLGINPFAIPELSEEANFRLAPHGMTDQYVNPNEFSISIVWNIGFLLIYLHNFRTDPANKGRFWMKLTTWALVFISLPVLGYLASRSSLIVLFIILAFVLLRMTVIKLSMIIPLAVLAGLVLGSAVLPDKIEIPFIGEHANERFSNISSESTENKKYTRKALAKAGFNVFLANPIFGAGLGNEKRYIKKMTGESKVSHNTYISILSEFGLLGIVVLLIFSSIWLSGYTKPATFNSLMMIGLYGLVHIVLYTTMTWVFLGLSYKMMELEE